MKDQLILIGLIKKLIVEENELTINIVTFIICFAFLNKINSSFLSRTVNIFYFITHFRGAWFSKLSYHLPHSQR